MPAAHDDIPAIALGWHRDGRGAALATVVETWGSAPRPVGSQLAVSGDGEIAGSVSGGCVEGAVVFEAMEALSDGKHRLLTYGVSDDEAFAVGLACGGTIRVLVEPIGGTLAPDLLADLVQRREAREAAAYVVDLETGTPHLAGRDAYPDRFRLDRSGVEEAGEFVAIHNPPLKLAVVGAGHIAQPLLAMADELGLDVTLIDPRDTFASPARFPGATIIADDADTALAGHPLDARTAIVTLAHDPKIDDPALIAGLRSEAFYIGALGSTRSHAKRVERLKSQGFSDDDIARIHAPVGLDIGGRSPAEIALSILAELTQVLRKG